MCWVNSASKSSGERIWKFRLGPETIPSPSGAGSEQSLPRTLKEADAARQAGADILLATPPYSYPASQEAHVEYFRQLSTTAQMPLIVYNYAETGVLIGPDAAQTVSRMPGIIGIKETSNLMQLQRMINNVQRPGEFIILTGDEYLFGPALLIGARCCTMGGPGNLVPQSVVQMHQLAETGGWDELSEMHRRLVAFCDALYALSDPPYSAVLAALSILGYGSGRAISPLQGMDQSGLDRVRAVLKEFEVC